MTELDPFDLAVHRVKVLAHQGLRWVDDRRDPIRPARASRLLVGLPVVAEDRQSLWNREVDPREWPLELGKVENLRVAARALDGLEFEAEQPFSFWAQVGPPLRSRGFVEGRELREGCVIPGVGGGLCLISNGLFAAASRARMTMLERHPHSKRPPGSRAALGEDATVAWNYVDLRFVGANPWRLELELDAEQLIVAIRSTPIERRKRAVAVVRDARAEQGPSCLSCDQPCESARPPDPRARIRERRTWLLDAVWPEYAAYLSDHARADDRVAIPIEGGLLGVSRYAWPRVPAGERRQFPIPALLRSLRSRQLASQGPARQRALLDDDRRLAAAMAASLTADDTELVVAHNLLPHLRRLGALGGRRVTVLMQRLPLVDLHARLDQAAQRWPSSPTLADFRADPRLLDDEARALELAAELVSPHADLADAPSCAGKLRLLDWSLPRVPTAARSRVDARIRLVLPASTVGRKGAYELRDALALSAIDATLWVAGRELEGPRFWPASLRVEHGTPSLAQTDAVVLPAWIEHQPRELLRAVAAGVPVIASRACGLGSLAGVRTVATGDVAELRAALVELSARAETWADRRAPV